MSDTHFSLWAAAAVYVVVRLTTEKRSTPISALTAATVTLFSLLIILNFIGA